jgi:hypothetical protein
LAAPRLEPRLAALDAMTMLFEALRAVKIMALKRRLNFTITLYSVQTRNSSHARADSLRVK